MEPIISVRGLGKSYRIQTGERKSYRTLRDDIEDFGKGLLKGKWRNSQTEEFWAIKDISFEIKAGEILGIIGRNGAGKSTLLKILSRVIQPTEGEAILRGRVASLLEVGTGFHPELSGRENIYISGAILGMSKKEIRKNFEEIVNFAEVEKFLDTPVKRYSSGMYVRLAFAVAAHLEPEILIVDEVLAVGDTQFQKKCLGKMENISSSGRTIIFVSHQMAAISNLCSSCILLQGGELLAYGMTDSIIHHYLETSINLSEDKTENLQDFRPSWTKPLIISARILNSRNQEQNNFILGSDITFEMTFATNDNTKLTAPIMGVVVNHTVFGTISGVNTRMTGFEVSECSTATMCCTLERVPFLQGNYTVDIWLGDGSEDVDTVTSYLNFRIEESDIYGNGRVPFDHMGVIFLEPKWQVK